MIHVSGDVLPGGGPGGVTTRAKGFIPTVQAMGRSVLFMYVSGRTLQDIKPLERPTRLVVGDAVIMVGVRTTSKNQAGSIQSGPYVTSEYPNTQGKHCSWRQYTPITVHLTTAYMTPKPMQGSVGALGAWLKYKTNRCYIKSLKFKHSEVKHVRYGHTYIPSLCWLGTNN